MTQLSASPSFVAPISLDDVERARVRIAPYLERTPLRHYPLLDEHVGHGIRVLVKHENHLPVNTFKVRNALSALTALPKEQAERGVIAASTGNHGQGLAWSGAQLGIPVTIYVPVGNNPEKNATIRSLGATLVEVGANYDACIAECSARAEADGMTLVHSTNNRDVLAGAGTLTLEVLEQAPQLDAMVIAVGGGSQAVGAIVVTQALRPTVKVYGVQSAEAPGQHEAWLAGADAGPRPSRTFAEGVATAGAYELTRESLHAGLTDFVLVPDAAIAQGIRDLLRTTHNLAEGAGATGLAGLRALARKLEGQTVAIIISGSNLDARTLERIVTDDL